MPVVRPCPSCGVGNRIPASHLADEGRCGQCKAALPPVAEPLEADAALFDEVMRDAAVPALVDFWAAWCAPCRMVAPEVAKAAQSLAGQAVVLKVDTERHPELAERYGVHGIPNFIVLKGGRVVMQRPGYAAAAQLEQWVREAAQRA